MLRVRVATALGLALLLVVAILYSPAVVTAGVLGLFALIGAWEWSAFLAASWLTRSLYVLALAVLGILGELYRLDDRSFAVLMGVVLVWWVVALLWVVFAPERVSRAVAGLAGLLALVPTWLALTRVDRSWSHGPQWTLFILALAFAADTGAYFVGRRYGRVRLAERVSPHKTWEGVGGGLLFAVAIGLIGASWFGVPQASFVPLCMAAALFSVVGDLTESLLKRHVHLKDSGRVFPGHGGVLDRLDSITAATPVMVLGLLWLGIGT